MRVNKFLAQATAMSRRAADAAIAQGSVTVNQTVASPGQQVSVGDIISYLGKQYSVSETLPITTTLCLHKPVGYVVSRNGQGSRTIYDLLPPELQHLKPVGRLDKDSSGLLLFTNDGDLANRLTHPRYAKTKQYQVTLDKPLAPLHRQMISDHGLQLDDGPSRMQLQRLADDQAQDQDDRKWLVTMQEGRNRQIRRTFAVLGYTVVRLHRTVFGDYLLGDLPAGQHRLIKQV